MLELYVIRHGLAGSSLTAKKEDEARRLTKKGKGKMKDIAKGLKEIKVGFDLILTSPLARAKESAEIVNDYCGNCKEVVVTDLLKPGASYNNLIKYLNTLKSQKKVAIVGHEPFLSSFASYCIAKSKIPLLTLKKGGVLMIEIDKVIKPGQCMLSWLMEPSQLIQENAD